MKKVSSGAARLMQPPSARLLWVLLALYTAGGVWILRGTRAFPALQWMDIYRLEDVSTPSDAWRFFAELRTGIPPVFAALEVGEQLLTGDTWLTDVVLYRVGMLAAFGLPIVAFRRSRLECVASFAICLLFLAAARIVGSPNPQIYDPLLPLFLIGPLLLLRAAQRWPRRALPLAAAAGTGLAMAELSRPFVLLLLPGLLLWGLLALRGLPRRHAVALLAPVLLLSGGWHAKLALAHGQILWSNNGGFNLQRAWNHEVRDWPHYVGKPLWFFERPAARRGTFEGSGQFSVWGWNTQAHAERSRELTAAVVRHILREPTSSMRHVAGRVGELLRPNLEVGKGAPLDGLEVPYQLAVRITAALLGVNLLLLLLRFARGPRLACLASLEAAWILTATAVILFLAVGDRGEEARFVISVLPFLAGLPRGWMPLPSDGSAATGSSVRTSDEAAVPVGDGSNGSAAT